MARPTLAALLSSALVLAACHKSSSTPAPASDPGAPLVLAAGMEGIEPSDELADYQVDLERLDLASVDSVFKLTTPADTPFSFDVLTRSEGNAGSARVSMAHGMDDGAMPLGGADSLARVGFVPGASGVVNRELWLDAHGDGFARMTVGGSVKTDQVLVFQTETEAGVAIALVEIVIGPASSINRAATGGNHPDVTGEELLYSSDSWQFGLPTAAVSGDRTSIVVYEGDRADWQAPNRYEMRLQYDAVAGEVTGGGSDEASVDTGHWRDHEIAALFNVLALAHCGTDQVTVRLSFDRGATFAQKIATAGGSWSTRLVQIAMADDYSLAVLFWRSGGDGTSELMLLEGRPSAVDAGGSPTWFSFDPPESLFKTRGDATPLLTGAAWSEGGDLVVGHAFATFESRPDRTWISTTQFWCSVRPWGGEFAHYLVDEDILVGKDPSVALLGSGPDLKIYYGYEGREGLRLRVSEDAGKTFSDPVLIGNSGAHTPTVFARPGIGGGVRVDVVYMTTAGVGSELHLSRWLEFGTSPQEDYRLTTAVMVPTDQAPGFGAGFWIGPFPGGHRLTQVAWMGYDAILDGDQIVVVYDEETYDASFLFLGAWRWLDAAGGVGFPTAQPTFVPAEPPPLAPGMTMPVPAPDVAHRHQLKLLRLN